MVEFFTSPRTETRACGRLAARILCMAVMRMHCGDDASAGTRAFYWRAAVCAVRFANLLAAMQPGP